MEQYVARAEIALPARRPRLAASWDTGATLLRNKRVVFSGLIIVLTVVGALIGPHVMPYDPDKPQVVIRLQEPTLEHWMGTDRLGRDVLSRILAGLVVSLQVAVGAVVFAVAIGVPLGALSGYLGKGFDALVMRIMDAVITFPSRLLAIALVAAAGASLWSLWFAIGFHSIPKFARIIRGGVLAQKEREYVEAARASGESSTSVLFRHILPNAWAPVAVQISLDFAHAITAEAGLSFLGLGMAPPVISLGQMLSEAQTYMESAPWTAIFPGLTLSIVILGFTLFGDGLRDVLDPRQKRR